MMIIKIEEKNIFLDSKNLDEINTHINSYEADIPSNNQI